MVDYKVFIISALFFLWGLNPYNYYYGTLKVQKFFNPVWILFWILPYLLIPNQYRELSYIVSNYIFLLMLIRKMGYTSIFNMLLVMFSLSSFCFAAYGNIDILVLTGMLYPTPIGILLLLAKPQITLVLIGVMLLKIYDKKGLLGVVLNSLPSLIAIILWLYLYGFPNFTPDPTANMSMPILIRIFVGLPLVFFALRNRSIKLGLIATVFCVPYVSINSYIAISLGNPLLGFLLGWIKLFSLLLPS